MTLSLLNRLRTRARKPPIAEKGVTFSVIVVFFNMRREAQRTLLSLSRKYQQGIDGIDYEVLCIDNGSSEPLDKEFVESFGPEFRLIRPDPALPSACKAINDAASQARGNYLCIMIDGAHVLSPGVLSQANEALTGYPEAMVALRQWFIGGDQRWLGERGYTRELEDQLFARSRWPQEPYSLFEIGRAMHDPSGGWHQSMSETNCLFLPAGLYKEIGGYDERFDEPGAGYANLDIFSRAATAVRGPIVSLLGEASFHQFHGGTTTNASDRTKNKLVSEYTSKFRQLKEHAFVPVDQSRLLFFGRLRSPKSHMSELRPLFANIPLSDELRPRRAHRSFDRGGRVHLLSAYRETDAAQTEWLGENIDLYPADLIALQEIIQRGRPECIIMPHASKPLVNFVGSIVKIVGCETRIIWPARNAKIVSNPFTPVDSIGGDQSRPDAFMTVRRLALRFDRILVLYSILRGARVAGEALMPYAGLVSPASYFVLLGTSLGRPYIGYATFDASAVLQRMMTKVPGFVVDQTWEHRHPMIASPGGFLLRTPDLRAARNEAIDKEYSEGLAT